MNLLKSSVKLSGVKIGTTAVRFLGLIYFSRALGPFTLGVFFLFESVSGVLKISSNLGIRAVIEKRISGDAPSGDVVASGAVLQVAVLLPFILGILVFRHDINGYVGGAVAEVMALVVVLEAAGQFAVVVLRGERRVGETAELQGIQDVGWVVAGIALLTVGFDLWALLGGVISGALLKLGWGIAKVSSPWGNISTSLMRDLLASGRYYILPTMNNFLFSWMDVLFIGYLLTQTDVGAYEVAWRVGLVISMFNKSLSFSLFPQVSSWDASAHNEKIASIIPLSLTLGYILVIPSFFGALVLSERILATVFTPEYASAATVLVIFAGSKMFSATRLVVEPVLRGIGRANLSTRAALVGGTTNLVLNPILIMQFGLVGAAVATTSAIFVTTAFDYYYLQEFVTVRFPTEAFLGLTAAAAVMAGAIMWVLRFVEVTSELQLALVVGPGVIVYGLAVALIPPARTRVFHSLRQVNEL